MAVSLTYTDAFEEAIREQPDEAAHRLIYADWLQDHDDPLLAARGEFIRLQCEREWISPDDPRQRELLRRERELWDRFGPLWADPVKSLVRSYEFRRGFVEKVHLDAGDFLRHAGRLFQLGPIVEVELAVRAMNLPALFNSPFLHRVTALDLDCSGADLPLLFRLFQTPTLAGLTGLRVRALHAPGLHALAAGRQFTRLNTLDLASNPVGPDGVEILASSDRLPALRTLLINTCQLTAQGVEALARSRLLEQLTALDLRSNGVTTAGTAALAWAPEMRNLEVLWLGFNAIGDSGLTALAASRWLTALTRLYLGSNSIHGPGLESLARSRLLANLTHLDLDYNELSPESLETLVASPHLDRLQTLYLRCGRSLTARFRHRLRKRLGERVCRF
jgi:uncharacterized protein (TIGR02996 family)